MAVLIGTSGWQYRDWKDRLYAGTAQKRWLERYTECFSTVEVNAAFYRLPKLSTFEGWRQRTPPGFVMAVKASRYLTHILRLRDPEEPVKRLMAAAEGLGDRLGPVLLQLPPTMRAEPDLLAACLDTFPRHVRIAVEPRHPTWWTPEVQEVLTARNAALCWADRRGEPVTPLWRTADWGYVRFHEGAAEPWPDYSQETLRTWLKRIADAWPSDADVFTFFNNDPNGAAVRNALTFGELVSNLRSPATPGD
jgi:uncharacterized protein YecE (DUF72 family)